MPREYCVWRPEEERALLTGVDRHGLGAWELIRTDPDLKSLLRCAVSNHCRALLQRWRVSLTS